MKGGLLQYDIPLRCSTELTSRRGKGMRIQESRVEMKTLFLLVQQFCAEMRMNAAWSVEM